MHLRANRMEWFHENRQLYGDMICYRIGPMRVFQITNPDHVGELLVKRSLALVKSRLVRWYFQRWMGEGLLLNEGPPWQRQRRKVRYALQQVPSTDRATLVARLARQILTPEKEQQLDIASAMDRLAFHLNVHVLLGEDASNVADTLYDAANTIHATGIREISRLSVLPDWLPLPSKIGLRQSIRTLDEILIPLIERRSQNPSDDLLSSLLTAQDRQSDSQGMSVGQVRDEAVNLMMGGKETVGAVLTWSSHLLSIHTETQERVAQEVGPWPEDRQSCLEDIPRWPLVQQIVLESMRLYPPVAMLAREVVAPVEVGPLQLRKGDSVLIPVYAIHRDERWHANPEQFDIERFQAASLRSMKQYTFMPFGAGPRSCVGKQAGFQQCLLALAWLVANVKLSPIPGATLPQLKMDIVLHPRDPLMIRTTPRDAGSVVQRPSS